MLIRLRKKALKGAIIIVNGKLVSEHLKNRCLTDKGKPFKIIVGGEK